MRQVKGGPTSEQFPGCLTHKYVADVDGLGSLDLAAARVLVRTALGFGDGFLGGLFVVLAHFCGEMRLQIGRDLI